MATQLNQLPNPCRNSKTSNEQQLGAVDLIRENTQDTGGNLLQDARAVFAHEPVEHVTTPKICDGNAHSLRLDKNVHRPVYTRNRNAKTTAFGRHVRLKHVDAIIQLSDGPFQVGDASILSEHSVVVLDRK